MKNCVGNHPSLEIISRKNPHRDGSLEKNKTYSRRKNSYSKPKTKLFHRLIQARKYKKTKCNRVLMLFKEDPGKDETGCQTNSAVLQRALQCDILQ